MTTVNNTHSIFELIGNAPCTHISNLVMINANEFITAGENKYFSDAKGIYKFNTKENKWTLFISYPKDLKISFHSICYNPNTNIIYMYCKENMMIKIDIKTSKSEINVVDLAIASYPSMFILNNKCHLIGGHDNKCHLIWDDNKRQFEKVFEFSEWRKGNKCHGLVHIPSQHSFLLFGGHSKNQTCFWKCKYESNNWQWIKISNARLPKKRLHKFGVVIDQSDQYLIVFGGVSSGQINQHIYVMNIKKFKWYKVIMDGPVKGHCYGILDCDMSVGTAVYGYVRNLANLYLLNIPQDLIRICHMYCSTEIMHMISDVNRKHYSVDLSHVIDNMIPL
eukprot:226079_1